MSEYDYTSNLIGNYKKLPVNDFPIFVFEIPSTGEKKRFRPFLVKEAKALVTAETLEDKTVMFETLKNIIKSCCLDEIDVDKLAVFDCEYLLIKLRSISVMEDIFVFMYCDGEHNLDKDNSNFDKNASKPIPLDPLLLQRDDVDNRPHGASDDEPYSSDIPDQIHAPISHEPGKTPDRKAEVKINLENVEVANLDKNKRNIKLSDTKMVIMRYPDLDVLQLIFNKKREVDYIEVVASCIDKIIVGEEIYEKEEMETVDLFNWIDTLDKVSFEKLVAFFNDLPYTRLKVEWDCPVCGKHNIKYLVGLEAFFE